MRNIKNSKTKSKTRRTKFFVLKCPVARIGMTQNSVENEENEC